MNRRKLDKLINLCKSRYGVDVTINKICDKKTHDVVNPEQLFKFVYEYSKLYKIQEIKEVCEIASVMLDRVRYWFVLDKKDAVKYKEINARIVFNNNKINELEQSKLRLTGTKNTDELMKIDNTIKYYENQIETMNKIRKEM